MKQLVFVFLTLLFTTHSFFSSSQCNRGRINGARCCGAHYDANNNGICDYSEVQELKDTVKVDNSKNVVTAKKNGAIDKEKNQRCGGCTEKKCIHKESAQVDCAAESSDEDEFKSMDETEIDTTAITAKELEETSAEKSKPYDLILISLLSFGLYGFTWVLVKLKKMKLSLHRKIWNFILLLIFLWSCLFGFFLVIQLNYNFVIEWYKTVLYWHVQVGIAMTIIAFFHSWWHLKYYVNMFKSKK